MWDSIRIMRVLLQREWRVIADNVYGDIINAFIMSGFVYISFGFFGEYSGISQDFAAKAYIASFVSVIVSLGFGRAFADISDYHFAKFFDYRRTLMLSTSSLLCVYLMSYVQHLAVVSLPVLCASKLLFYHQVNPDWYQLLMGSVIYIGSLVLCAVYYLNMVFLASFQWFFANIWQRVNTPLLLFGGMLYSWQKLYDLNPYIASIFLLNPITYVSEGLRNTLVNTPDARLTPLICLAMVWLCACIGMFILLVVARRRIDG